MAERTPGLNSNIDHNRRAAEDWENHHNTGDRYPKDAKGIGETEVKNAHAAGDGAMERNDAGLGEGKNTGPLQKAPGRGEESGEADPPY